MDIKIVDAPEETPEKPIGQPKTVEGAQPDEIYQTAIGQVLGLENTSDVNKYSPQLKTLIEYAKTQTTDLSPESIKWVIRSLELKLGSPPFAEDRVKYVTRYAYLLNEEKRIKDEKGKFERI